MKRAVFLFIVIIGVLACCRAAELDGGADISAIKEFAAQSGGAEQVQSAFDRAMHGEVATAEEIIGWIKSAAGQPLQDALNFAACMVCPVLMLALVQCAAGGKGTGAAEFVLRLELVLTFSKITLRAVESAGACISSAAGFIQAVSPVLTAVLAASGMTATTALISPAAALAGYIAAGIFETHGLRLCRIALCAAAAGSLTDVIRLDSVVGFLKKIANLGAGLALSLFTGLLALQGSVAGTFDSAAVRTAKFTVDSASPVIGSGVSDAWESYVSGVLVIRNAVGLSGITALLCACMQPVITCLMMMLLLGIVSAVTDLFGEGGISKASTLAGSVCQMALSLCTASIAVATVLMGAAMSAGRGILA